MGAFLKTQLDKLLVFVVILPNAGMVVDLFHFKAPDVIMSFATSSFMIVLSALITMIRRNVRAAMPGNGNGNAIVRRMTSRPDNHLAFGNLQPYHLWRSARSCG